MTLKDITVDCSTNAKHPGMIYAKAYDLEGGIAISSTSWKEIKMFKNQKGFTVIELVIAVVELVVPIAIVCVVVHFVAKFW